MRTLAGVLLARGPGFHRPGPRRHGADPARRGAGFGPGGAAHAAPRASFSIPPGWTQQVSGGLVVLNPPESDTHLAIVDVPQAADAESAIAAGWKAYRGGESHAFKLLTPLPPRNGWDEQAVVQYETSPSEHLAIQGIARRKGSGWTVLILDGSESTVEKRSGPLGPDCPEPSPRAASR